MVASSLAMNHDQVAMPLQFFTNGNDSHPGSEGCELTSQSGLSGESNADSIRALDEEVRKLEELVIKSKRIRNSLLNVNKLPAELLGDIFHRNVMFEDDFGGLAERSHNFLLVCHRWFEVASTTPKVWSFWGNTLEDWVRLYPRSKTASLDLVLNHFTLPPIFNDEHLMKTLVNTLQEHASRGYIRRIHLKSRHPTLLTTMLSSLTVKGGDLLCNPIESFILETFQVIPVDVSDFFSHCHFPNLKRLKLSSCTIQSWNYLISATSSLTVLSLGLKHPSPNPTMTQLLSLLGSNPLLQRVQLHSNMAPDDDDGVPSSRVRLNHLRHLNLTGGWQHVPRLHQQLDYPGALDSLTLTLPVCPVDKISETIKPHFWDHFKRGHREQCGLVLTVLYGGCIELDVGNVVEMDTESGVRMGKTIALSIRLGEIVTDDRRREVVLDLFAQVRREEFVYLKVSDEPGKIEAMSRDVCANLPNLKTLHLVEMHLPTVFSKNDLGVYEAIPPELEHLTLELFRTDDSGWSPLTTFLADRAPSGKRLSTLKILFSDHIRPEVVEEIKGVVGSFAVIRNKDDCRFGCCFS